MTNRSFDLCLHDPSCLYLCRETLHSPVCGRCCSGASDEVLDQKIITVKYDTISILSTPLGLGSVVESIGSDPFGWICPVQIFHQQTHKIKVMHITLKISIIKNQHRFIITPDLPSVEMNQISQGANLSSSFVLIKRFTSWEIWSSLCWVDPELRWIYVDIHYIWPELYIWLYSLSTLQKHANPLSLGLLWSENALARCLTLSIFKLVVLELWYRQIDCWIHVCMLFPLHCAYAYDNNSINTTETQLLCTAYVQWIYISYSRWEVDNA